MQSGWPSQARWPMLMWRLPTKRKPNRRRAGRSGSIRRALTAWATTTPVVIVEFYRLPVPFCSRHFLQTYPQIKADYVDTGKVRYVFMDFPLSSIHPQAQVAAGCALRGRSGAYLTMHDMLFAPTEWGGRGDAAEIFSGYVGATWTRPRLMNACRAASKRTQCWPIWNEAWRWASTGRQPFS